MSDPSSVEARERTPVVGLIGLVVMGGCLMSAGLGGRSPVEAGITMALLLVVWTSLLPRLSVFRGVDVFVASHGLAAGTFWCVTILGISNALLIGNTALQRREFFGGLVTTVAASALALAGGWALDRASRRHPVRVIQALALALPVLVGTFVVLVLLVRGEAPFAVEVLRAAPRLATLGPTEPKVRVRGWTFVRTADGPVVALSDAEDAALEAEPGDARSPVARWSRTPMDIRVCHRTGDGSLPLEIREVAGVLLVTTEHALDDDYAWGWVGCAHDVTTGERVPLRVSDLEHPLACTDRFVQVGLGAAFAGTVQVILALVALARRARLRRAREGISDGRGTITFADGTEARAVAPAGSVLAMVRGERGSYRESAKRDATVLAAGSHEEARHRAERTTCVALTAAVGALAVGVLPFAALVANRLVVSF